MPNIKINTLTPLTSPAGTEITPIGAVTTIIGVDTVRVPMSTLRNENGTDAMSALANGANASVTASTTLGSPTDGGWDFVSPASLVTLAKSTAENAEVIKQGVGTPLDVEWDGFSPSGTTGLLKAVSLTATATKNTIGATDDSGWDGQSPATSISLLKSIALSNNTTALNGAQESSIQAILAQSQSGVKLSSQSAPVAIAQDQMALLQDTMNAILRQLQIQNQIWINELRLMGGLNSFPTDVQ